MSKEECGVDWVADSLTGLRKDLKRRQNPDVSTLLKNNNKRSTSCLSESRVTKSQRGWTKQPHFSVQQRETEGWEGGRGPNVRMRSCWAPPPSDRGACFLGLWHTTSTTSSEVAVCCKPAGGSGGVGGGEGVRQAKTAAPPMSCGHEEGGKLSALWPSFVGGKQLLQNLIHFPKTLHWEHNNPANNIWRTEKEQTYRSLSTFTNKMNTDATFTLFVFVVFFPCPPISIQQSAVCFISTIVEEC